MTSYDIPGPLVFLQSADYERLTPEGVFRYLRNEGDHRNPFERDRGRIVHSRFFRTLAGKTQVFGPNQSDFFRTRLTHSLEVAQIAKAMTVQLCEEYRSREEEPRLSPWEQVHLCDLVETVCLAHDIGQCPFGHTGEASLDVRARELGGEGFEANAQSLRVLTHLDAAYPGRPGFTRGVLAGVMKYKIRSIEGLPKFIYNSDWDVVEKACPGWDHDKARRESGSAPHDFETKVKRARTFACQIMDLADEIVYAGHDIEDILYTPILRHGTLDMISDLVSHVDDRALRKIREDVEMQSGTRLSTNVLEMSWNDLKSSILGVLQSGSASGFRSAAHMLRREHMNLASASSRAVMSAEGLWTVRISHDAAVRSALIRYVIMPFIYKDSRLVTLQRKGSRVVMALLSEIASGGELLLPAEHREAFAAAESDSSRVQVCCDYIAEMTEEHALGLYRRLFESERGVLTDFF